MVTVLAAGVPILNSPLDINYHVSDPIDYNITWIATHNNPDAYIVYEDGEGIYSGVWNSANPIVVDLDGYPPGSYNFTIVVFDAFGQSATDTVIVTVTSVSPSGITIEEGGTILVAAISHF